MPNRALQIFAGPKARTQLLQRGLEASQFKAIVGASGGPKWFVLYGLDRYLFGEYFANHNEPLLAIGSSAGAWRLSCLATADPVAAVTRLAHHYATQKYSDKPDIAEVTLKAKAMVADFLGPTGAAEIVANRKIQLHLVSARARGILASKHAFVQGSGIGLSALANVVSRKNLSWFYQRTLFTNMLQASPYASLTEFNSVVVPLQEDNVHAAVLASGSIPFVLTGERDIRGGQPGLYLDGGIIDYHFDIPFYRSGNQANFSDIGLVLYPHFSPKIIPGWFDKKLPWRAVTGGRKQPNLNYDNVVLLCPSDEFVRSLPKGKIPERNDFLKYDQEERISVWLEVVERSKELADDFAELVDNDLKEDDIQSLF